MHVLPYTLVYNLSIRSCSSEHKIVHKCIHAHFYVDARKHIVSLTILYFGKLKTKEIFQNSATSPPPSSVAEFLMEMLYKVDKNFALACSQFINFVSISYFLFLRF